MTPLLLLVLLVLLLKGGRLCVSLPLVPLLHPQKRYDQHSRMHVERGPARTDNGQHWQSQRENKANLAV